MSRTLAISYTVHFVRYYIVNTMGWIWWGGASTKTLFKGESEQQSESLSSSQKTNCEKLTTKRCHFKNAQRRCEVVLPMQEMWSLRQLFTTFTDCSEQLLVLSHIRLISLIYSCEWGLNMKRIDQQVNYISSLSASFLLMLILTTSCATQNMPLLLLFKCLFRYQEKISLILCFSVGKNCC